MKVIIKDIKEIKELIRTAYGIDNLPIQDNVKEFYKFDSVNSMSKEFFSEVNASSLEKAFFTIVGDDRLKWAEKTILPGKILVAECETRNTPRFTLWGVV